MHNYSNLQIWQQAMELVVEVYKLTKTFPAEEKYGLVSQMNRAAVSVPSNIAEGAGRGSNKDFSHFISISIGYAIDHKIISKRCKTEECRQEYLHHGSSCQHTSEVRYGKRSDIKQKAFEKEKALQSVSINL